jgi:hypothetical protein
MGVDYAINSPSGDLAQALVSVLFARNPKRHQGLPNDLQPRIERLLTLPEEGGSHALTMIAQQLHRLFVIDPAWTRRVLLPCFDPAGASAEAAWSGFLSAARMPSSPLFHELKTFFLAAFDASPRWTCRELKYLAQILALALESISRGRALMATLEARTALRNACSDIRQEALFFLRGRVADTGAWNKVIVPFFRDVWPRERKFQTPETTRTLMLFLSELGDRFPEGVRLVSDFLVPSDNTDVFAYQFGNDGHNGHADLTTRYPRETLTVFDKIIDVTQPHRPYGLAQVVTRLAEAAPELRHDERWQSLHRLALS